MRGSAPASARPESPSGTRPARELPARSASPPPARRPSCWSANRYSPAGPYRASTPGSSFPRPASRDCGADNRRPASTGSPAPHPAPHPCGRPRASKDDAAPWPLPAAPLRRPAPSPADGSSLPVSRQDWVPQVSIPRPGNPRHSSCWVPQVRILGPGNPRPSTRSVSAKSIPSLAGLRSRWTSHRRLPRLRPLQHLVVSRRFVFKVVRSHVIPPHRVVLESLPHQQPPQVRMPRKHNPVQVEYLPLLKLRRPPDGRQRRQFHLGPAVRGVHPDNHRPMLLLNRIQVIDRLQRLRPIYPGHIREVIEPEFLIVAQELRHRQRAL